MILCYKLTQKQHDNNHFVFEKKILQPSMSAKGAAHIDESGQVVMGRRDKKRKLTTAPEPMNQSKRLVVVLEAACLEVVKCMHLLICSNHFHSMLKCF